MPRLGIDERLERVARFMRARLGLPRRAFALAVVAYLAFIWLLSSSHPPGPELFRSPALKYAIELLYNTVHVPLFAGLAFAWILALGRGPSGFRVGGGILASAFALTVAYGVVDEIHQSFTPGRTPSAFDVANDAVGALVAIVFTVRVLAPARVTRGQRALVEIAALFAVALVISDLSTRFGDALEVWWRRGS